MVGATHMIIDKHSCEHYILCIIIYIIVDCVIQWLLVDNLSYYRQIVDYGIVLFLRPKSHAGGGSGEI